MVLVVAPDGNPYELTVEKGMGYGLDEAAIEAVRHWRFRPGTKDGSAVAVQIRVEVEFKFVRH